MSHENQDVTRHITQSMRNYAARLTMQVYGTPKRSPQEAVTGLPVQSAQESEIAPDFTGEDAA